MTWDAFHHRGDVLRSVVDEANRRRDGALPTELPGVTETFGDELSLVTALQLRWNTRLAGHIERALSELPDDLETAVVTAWRATAGELVGVRQILDAQRVSAGPELAAALDTARRKDAVLMAAMAGLASPSDPAAVTVGERLETAARSAYRPTAAPRHLADEQARPTLVERIKSHLPAA
jgi:hypothetical protein